ncbi:MAG: hypothetical protein IKW81_10030 [Pseudobutyrivibrio sp.]|uniref:Uncharacterized protein n=1 Tax=Pseudobutyrivibrio xylanivorans TaxID=185007 RepID=A0A6M0LJ83_PSEXY|nr:MULTISPECIES: hypothetical protein [Pseudobutyrivibrio]MBR5637253.1 hypothetical protein [Pseudobutyrivibrio sp.]NEX02466.1 hypothetical protein [Pseudobutyrivibrio xylanivorans]SFR83094.1 hypothetical protein SAMN04487829_2462 [Pseudobutyrivibrio sp. NOR37]
MNNSAKKKIIEKIVVEDAKKHGFTCKSIRGGLGIKYLAIFGRKKNGVAQGFDIYENVIKEGNLTMLIMGKKIETTYHDEESFEIAMKYYADYLNNHGYEDLDANAVAPRFETPDRIRLRDEYVIMAQHFNEKCGNLNDDGYLEEVRQYLTETFNYDFEEVKEDLLLITAAFATYIARIYSNATLKEADNDLLLVHISTTSYGRVMERYFNPLNTIKGIYDRKDISLLDIFLGYFKK